jgi:peptide/nickel transport system substrate-binding protein
MKCGKPNGFSTRMVDDLESATDPPLVAVEQRALGRVGIQLTRYELGATGLFVFTASPAQLKEGDIGLWLNDRVADYRTAYGFYQPIGYDDRPVPNPASGGVLVDQTIEHLMDGTPKSDRQWQRLNHAVMVEAVSLPFLWPRVLEYRSPRMTNVTTDLALASGSYDFVNVGVR